MLKGYPSSVAINSFMQEEMMQQMKSEQEIFGCNKSNRGPKEMLVHIPHCSKMKRQQDLKVVKNNVDSQEPFLQTTSKIPLNFQGLDDDKLFVSTLNENARHYSHNMKRHSSHQEKGNQYCQYSTTRRRCSLSEEEELAVPAGDLILIFDNRRTSVQSDSASSTELIRRFSSGSTTSTVATSISSSSMMTNDNKLYGNNNNYAQTTTNASISSSMNSVASSSRIKDSSQAMESTEKEIKLISQQENNIPNEPQQQQKLGRDPGHTCNTMQSPFKTTTTTAKHSADDKPIWADSVKIKENPMRYEFIQNYLKFKDISLQSSLPLSKSCMFYFSDTNYSSDYASTVKPVFQCDTVWQFSNFWRIFYKQLCYWPSQLTFNQNIYCFNKGVEPMWEDETNRRGGRLIIGNIQQAVLDDLFEWIILAFIGGNLFDDGVVGIAFSKRYRGDRIELWLNESNNTIVPLQETLCNILPSVCHNEINASRYKKHF